jgi:MFS family permease
MSGLIGAKNQFAAEFNNPDAKLQGIITSIYDIGCAAGCLFCFFFGERFGRKSMIIAGGATMIIGTILLGSSTTLAQLLVGRIVTGVGNGFNLSTILMYQSEMCKPGNRGIILSMQGTVIITGLCIAYVSLFSTPPKYRKLTLLPYSGSTSASPSSRAPSNGASPSPSKPSSPTPSSSKCSPSPKPPAT